MPLFEFICEDCKTKFEKMIFSINKETVECPQCKSKKVVKQFSTFSSGTSSHTHSGGCCSHMTPSACSTKKMSGGCNGCCGH